ncbi:MAG: flagellar motor switch protein FliM [candidate division Zixibacteria bacterium]|nr:flagellar motor switch protein FliM [candidate division Zixibacteria bacterium]
MAKILSQDEIDALLTTVSSGEKDIEEQAADDDLLRNIIAYDFKHPNRVSKDQIRTLENMHDNLAGHYSSSLSTIARTIVDIDLVSVDQITYSEFIMSLVTPSCTFTFSAEPLEGVCLIDFNPTLTFAFVERMFGGSGKVMESERELTSIERMVMGRLASKFFQDLGRSWKNILELNIEQKSFETNPQFIQIVPPGETVIVVSFQVKLYQSTGLLTICYPYMALESIISKLSAQNWIDATKIRSLDADKNVNRENLGLVDVDVSATLMETSLKMKDFLQLKIGDIVPSERKINEPLDIYVSKRKKFLGRPGLSGKKRAFQVTEVYENPLKEAVNNDG